MSVKKDPKDYLTRGAPTVVTPEALHLLKTAFLLDCTDTEACFSANISTSTLYNYQTANPDFLELKQQLKKYPVMAARQIVIDGMAESPELALKYLERKLKKEFSLRQENINADVNKDEFEKMTEKEYHEDNKRMLEANPELLEELGYVKEGE